MKTNEKPLTSILLSLFVVILLLLPVQYIKAAPLQPFGTLDDIVLEKLTGKERVLLVLSKQADVASEIQSDGSIQVRLNGVTLPDRLQRIIGEGTLSNVTRIRPVQVDADGKSGVVLHIDLKDRAPYSIFPQGGNVVIEFTLISKPSIVETKLADIPRAGAKSPTNDPEQTKVFSATEQEMQKTRGRFQDDRRMTIDFPDQDLKMIFRLLAEESGKNFVLGDEIKGNITIHMRNSTWKEILDSILYIKNLEIQEQGNTIRVMTREAMAKYKTLVKDAAMASIQEAALVKAAAMAAAIQDDALITRVVPIKYRLLKFVVASRLEVKGEARVSARESADVSGVQRNKDLAVAASGQTTKKEKVSLEGVGDFFALLQSFLSVDAEGNPRGWIGADADTNSIIITATKYDMDKIMDMIAKTDIPIDQILIKANIVETTKSTARNLGIQWGGVFGQRIGNQSLYVTPGGTGGSTVPPGSGYALSGVNPTDPTLGYIPTSGVSGIGGQGYGVNFPAASLGGGTASLGLLFGVIGGNILDVQLSALQKDGKLNILSSPSLVTLDNQMASTENGDDVPFVTPGAKTGDAPTVTWKKAGLKLEITPHVIDGKNIKMTILVKKDELDFSRQVQGNPVIIQKETKTDLVVTDGETIVISGLTKQKKTDDTNGVPWLKEIPVLGWLFKGEGKSELMEEVLIFITPNIMKPQEMTGIQTGP